MYYRREGLPEESEIVMCTITKIQYSSVFANLDDFNVSGMIHISEIAAGRIRNIRDYVKEGKKVVCKVLKIHHDKGHIDLSLRRVNDSQRRNKVNEVKLEQKAESIIEYVAKQNNIPVKKLYDQITEKVFEDFNYVHEAFEHVVDGDYDLSSIGLDKNITAQIDELVQQRFKQKLVEITGTISLSTYDSKGLDTIKEALSKAEAFPGVDIRYLGGGKYRIVVEAKEYKDAETVFTDACEAVISHVKSKDGTGEYSKKSK